jgi:hypothetical protein
LPSARQLNQSRCPPSSRGCWSNSDSERS